MTKILASVLGSLVLAAPVAAAIPTLTATVGPGFTIGLTKKGVKVKTLRAGTYRLVVRDKSDEHDFHLKGPGLNRVFTTVGFVGTRTFTIKLRAGKYTFLCDPHPSSMRGGFTVR